VSAPHSDTSRTRLLQRLLQLRRRYLAFEITRATATAAALITGLGAGLVLVEAALYLPSTWRIVLLAAVLLTGIIWPAAQLRCLLPGGMPLRRIALQVEQRAPELSQRLITALELGPADGVHRSDSAQLLEAVTDEATALLGRSEVGQLIPATLVRRSAVRLACVAAIVLLAGFGGGASAHHALHRVLHPTQSFQQPQRTHVRVAPTDLEVIRGDDASIFVHLSGDIPATMRLIRQESETPSTEEIVLPSNLTSGDSVHYAFTGVQHQFSFRVEAGDGHVGPIAVAVIDPPAVSRLRLAYEYPSHTGLAPRVEQEGGDIRALAGTRIEFDITATKSLSAATLVIDDTVRLAAQVVDQRARVAWSLPTPAAEGDAEHHYRIELLDKKEVQNRDPIRYAVHILRDAAPHVAIPVPGRDGDLPENQQVALEIEATDDFGISSLDLVFRLNDGPEERLVLARDTGPLSRLRHAWDLSARELLPEDRVTYWAEAFDNDAIAGPKKAVSHEFVLRFPSLYELFSETAQQQEEAFESLEKLAEQEAEALQTVERLRREVLRTEEMTWEQRQELETTLAGEEERARKVEELAREMAETMAELEEGGLSSSDIVEKMDEIRELMAAVTSPELLEALQALQQQLENPDPEQLAEALQQFAQDQEAFQERLERTLELLRRVQAEQRLLAAVAQSEDLAQRQSTINDAIGKEDAARLGEQESAMARDTDHLQAELQDLSSDFSDISQQTAAALQAEAQRMTQQKLSGRMQQMEQSLVSQPTDARRQGEGLQEDLARLNQSLQSLQASFDGQQRAQMSKQLRHAMAGLVGLSQHQEQLTTEITARNQGAVTELATQQQALARGVELVVEQIGRVSQQTLALDSGLATTIGYALTRMEEAAQHLGQRQATRAAAAGGTSVGYLNEAVMQLRQSIDNLNQAATASAFGEAMEKMMGLSQQQMALNQATQQALQAGSQPGEKGGRGNGQDGMPRLAAQQRRIYRALGEVEKSLRGQRSMEGRVESIRKDMETVLARMQRNAADPLVRQGQERILQRMLDASRSIHNRGFEKRRRSETARQRLYDGPEWLPVDLGQQPDALADAMRRALAGNYPVEYRQLIKRYYETVYDDLHAGSGTTDEGMP
jgi:hypothetical protein